ncbi:MULTISPECIES: 3'(2'),5'-bisphosphate nucleotidase CysQ [unclassified Rhodococcus (in: high G+C Gram-positive bacteria)]|uniref:3'(2'),5'-bisphosphate nucleotidase CysQ n=1 Tax=unclassified Rhodococcus (in: high G+C Gram-positive bacteria) TaxID=192944 RepID=UPI0013202FDA|nr:MULTISPECIES: 3'(2'),5'-bisphosphate nucleotidase CysQ [unclassified Rhodococcus (in: high G+C Gram-positive bacteria)]QHE68729.1 putative CysQ protein [Rhodococcus sp. WAY2]
MTSDARLAADIASGAGALLLDIRAAGLGSADGRELGRRGDVAADAFIAGKLAAERPGDSILSEESADDRSRLDSDRVWIIDPLDGSKEYGLPGHSDWAVHVALWERGQGVTAAAVAQPALGAVYASDDPSRAVHAEELPARPRIVVSASRPPAFIDAVATQVGAEVRAMGSAGAKAMAVLRGDVDAYVHAGGQWEWDSAAPVGVAAAAGLHCSRIDGTPLQYNQSHPYLPDLVICRPELAQVLLAAIADHATDSADSGRVAMARAYIDALVSHDATKVRLSESAWRVENGQHTGDSGAFIRDELENGPQYQAIQAVRDLSFHEWGENVVARFLLDLGAAPTEVTTVRITEHFHIPAGAIQSVMAIIEPHVTEGNADEPR